MEKNYNIDADFDYYIKHQSELVDKYDGKFIVIADQEVFGAYDDLDAAFDAGNRKYGPGNFFLHQVGDGKDNYSTTISRVGTYVQ